MDIKQTFYNWLNKVDATYIQELKAIENNENEINERFGGEMAFGTAGMRAEVGIGTFRMNIYTVRRATEGLAKYICSLGDVAKAQGVVISYDTRRMSLEFAISVAEVLTAYGIRGYLFEDVRPVPMCSFAIRNLGAIAGVMVTASHNPKQYNGYKVYGEDGAQMSPESTAQVVRYIDDITDYFATKYTPILLDAPIKGYNNIKLNQYITVIGEDVDSQYFDAIASLSLSPEAIKKVGKDIKLVYTPIHGAGYMPVTTILKRLNINAVVVKEQALPDTEFSTVSVPNPENKDTLSMGIALGETIGADVVIGTDPDCDRMGVAIRDNKGEFSPLNGNQIGVLLLDYILTRLKETNTMPKNGAVVKTIVTTSLANAVAESFGVTVFDVLTGFKFIGEKIKEWEGNNKYTFIFGYEESFGYLRGTHARDKDAVVATMLFSEMVCYYQTLGITVYDRLEAIFAKFGYYHECNVSVTYKGVSAMKEMADAMTALRSKVVKNIGKFTVLSKLDYLIRLETTKDNDVLAISLPSTDAIYYKLENGQFVCIRPSGTEPKLKIYVLTIANSADASSEKANEILEHTKNLLKN